MSPTVRRSGTDPSLTEFLFPLDDPDVSADLEQFRVDYERRFGPTDVGRIYTSMLPKERREWLFEHFPEHYWNGLPPYAQAFLIRRIKSAASDGKLDLVSDSFLSLYSQGKLRVRSDEDRHR